MKMRRVVSVRKWKRRVFLSLSLSPRKEMKGVSPKKAFSPQAACSHGFQTTFIDVAQKKHTIASLRAHAGNLDSQCPDQLHLFHRILLSHRFRR